MQTRTSERAARSHETAAFAGDVDGRTRQCPRPARLAPRALLGSLAEHTLVGGLADEADGARPEALAAIVSSRSRAPAKSAARRSPRAPGRPARSVVRPTPIWGSEPNSLGARSGQSEADRVEEGARSFRGFANGARAAALTRPGLIPQKTTRTPGARDIRDGRLGQAASGSRASRRSSSSIRSFSPKSLTARSLKRILARGAASRSPRRSASRNSARSTPPR